MNASMMVVKSDGTSQEIVIRKERIVVGREKDLPLRIPARSVSRQHCEFVIEENQLLVRDLGSSNGTFVNRERVEYAVLHSGDLISVGPAVFAVMLDGEPSGLEPSDVYARGSVELADDAAPPKPPQAAQAAAALAGGVSLGGGDGGDPDDSDLAMDALADNDDSSLLDFDFDLGDDEDDDEQPGL